MKRISLGGPGAMVTAAFVGPGTVTVCSLAGANHGHQLLWAVVLSIGITLLFQEMALRLALVTGKDLVSLIREKIQAPIVKALALILIFSAIVIGNGAYEAGNISGGALGVTGILPNSSMQIPVLVIGLFAFLLLWMGSYKVLQKVLVLLVALMSLAFTLSAAMIVEDFGSLLQGLFIPNIPSGGLITVLGVVGTTVVPYNLFMHASLAKTHWASPDALPQARKDLYVSVLIGGLISLSIVICAASLTGQTLSDATDLGKGLEPLFGTWAKYMISIGLFAAGITSAITAPLAAAYVVTGIFDKESSMTALPFRLTWMLILGIGVLFSLLGFKPIEVIRFAQVANGLVLPFIAIFLVWLSNQKSLMADKVNQPWLNVLGVAMILIVLILGWKSVWVL